MQTVNELGIKLIIDLRSEEEIDRSPDAEIEGAGRLVNTLAMDEFNDLLEGAMVSGDTSPLTVEAVIAAHERMYPDNTGPFGRLLTEIFEASHRPVLIHCAGGVSKRCPSLSSRVRAIICTCCRKAPGPFTMAVRESDKEGI